MVVFVLDDFDMFASAAKQTVLYNLLDSMQAPGTQVMHPFATDAPGIAQHAH